MAKELQAFTTTGLTVYAVLINTIGQIWDGSVWETIAAETWTDYDIALTEATSGLYLGDMPSVVAGIYNYVAYQRLGASPAITDNKVGVGYIEWNGTAVLPHSGLATPTNITAAAGITLADDAISASKFDESTAFPLKKQDASTTELARKDSAASYKADVSALALEATLTAIKGAGWTDETLVSLRTWIAANIDSSATNGTIKQIRGNTWDFDVEDLTLDDTLIQFVIKNDANDQDNDAILMIDNVTGLLRVNGAAGTAGDASLAYAGTTLTVEVAASVTALLPAGVYHYGIQSIDGSGNVAETYGGTFTITADMVRATA